MDFRLRRSGGFLRLVFTGVLIGGLAGPGTAVAVAPPPAAVTWRELGTLGGSWSTPTDMNSAGQVVGYGGTSDGRIGAFLWHRGVLTELSALGETTEASAVNERGEVAGSSGGRPVLWRDGVVTDLVAVPSSGRAIDVNDHGEVIGVRETPTSGMYGQGYLWRKGRSVDLPDLGGDTYPVAINNRGEAVGFAITEGGGSEAVLWRRGQVIRLAPPSVQVSMAHAINDRGQVLGSMKMNSSTWHEFMWHGGVLTDLGAITTVGINDRGEIAGNPQGSLGTWPVRWHRGTATELVSLDGRSGQASAINSAGSVAGQFVTADYQAHGVVWTRNRVIDLGPLTYGIFTGGVYFINDRGLVVGVLNPTGDGYRAVVWDTVPTRR